MNSAFVSSRYMLSQHARPFPARHPARFRKRFEEGIVSWKPAPHVRQIPTFFAGTQKGKKGSGSAATRDHELFTPVGSPDDKLRKPALRLGQRYRLFGHYIVASLSGAVKTEAAARSLFLAAAGLLAKGEKFRIVSLPGGLA